MSLLGLTLAAIVSGHARAQLPQDAIDSGQVECTAAHLARHNPDVVTNADHETCFEAYISSFDTGKKRDDQSLRFVGVPHWVAQRVDKVTHAIAEGRARPSRWLTLPDLNTLGMAPTHASYHFSAVFLSQHKNWYERGHLAQKYLAERLQNPASTEREGPGWYTHNLANAVPQRARFNKGPWLTLECYTGAWANRFGAVWIVSGPIYVESNATAWLKSDKNKKALPVAIPDALFKIVAKKVPGSDAWDILAFIYPQDDESYAQGPWNPGERRDTVKRIEELTRQTYFPTLDAAHHHLKDETGELWAVDRTDFDPSCRRFAPKEL